MTSPTSRLMAHALEQGVFAGASLLVARAGEVLWEEQVGWARRVPTPLPLGRQMRFDLASLTKPLVTTTLAMLALDRGQGDLEERLGARLPLDGPLARVTPWHLLAHASGLPAWRPLYRELDAARAAGKVAEGRVAARQWLRAQVAATPLQTPPGARSCYSDLGFMLLDWWLEQVFGDRIDRVFAAEVAAVLGMRDSEFVDLDQGPRQPRDTYVATEDCAWRGRVLQGEVHDQNTWAMGGVAGQAGLFATAADVYKLLWALQQAWAGQRGGLVSPETVRRFWAPAGVPGSAFRLGWDGPSPSGYRSVGRGFSERAVGHLGFTGCSVWHEPETACTVILLTNRIHPDVQNEQIRAFRPALHDCVVDQWFS